MILDFEWSISMQLIPNMRICNNSEMMWCRFPSELNKTGTLPPAGSLKSSSGLCPSLSTQASATKTNFFNELNMNSRDFMSRHACLDIKFGFTKSTQVCTEVAFQFYLVH